jgi:hypothetical protein
MKEKQKRLYAHVLPKSHIVQYINHKIAFQIPYLYIPKGIDHDIE